MKTVRGLRAGAIGPVAAAVLVAALTGCSDEPDRARSVRSAVAELAQVVSAEVTTATTDRGAVIRLNYAASADSPRALAAIVAGVDEVATERGYSPYRLILVPATKPDSRLSVDSTFGHRAGATRLLRAWLRVTSAVLGPVTYEIDRASEAITVDSKGGAAHDVAQVRRLRHGSATTTWVFRTGSGTFTADGRIRAGDARLFRAVQRNAGAGGQPASVLSWRLDRRQSHVRLDLDLGLTPRPPATQLTIDRYGRSLAPLVRTALTALATTGRPAWLSLHVRPDSTTDDTFATWASDRPSVPGRDPLNRGWDAWLAAQARAAWN